MTKWNNQKRLSVHFGWIYRKREGWWVSEVEGTHAVGTQEETKAPRECCSSYIQQGQCIWDLGLESLKILYNLLGSEPVYVKLLILVLSGFKSQAYIKDCHSPGPWLLSGRMICKFNWATWNLVQWGPLQTKCLHLQHICWSPNLSVTVFGGRLYGSN